MLARTDPSRYLCWIRTHTCNKRITHAPSNMVSKNTKTLVFLAALLLACAGTTSSAARHLEEAAPEEHPAVPELPVPEHELPPLPKVELPPKPELPPFPEVHLPPKTELPPIPKAELPPKPEMPGVPEFHFPELKTKP
ncbi:protein PELPK1-like [Phragmites australis]|uniref:protein PELPK1-like n=1 Tax=Phragmites australis TaxID=29695 RepID=UPI002D768851|nr:protein PELPK1-like [Phragmites australis]